MTGPVGDEEVLILQLDGSEVVDRGPKWAAGEGTGVMASPQAGEQRTASGELLDDRL